MITPNPKATPSPSSPELPVPLDLLAIDGVAPAVGDETEIKVGVRIARVEGSIAFVQPTSIEGTPIPDQIAAEVEPTDEGLAEMAAKADQETA